MANDEHKKNLLLGVDAWNEWRASLGDLQPDLADLVMPEAHLSAINLNGANLRGADLHRAALSDADLEGADLANANLRGTLLHGANLNWSFLRDADLNGADLEQARLEEAFLQGADLSGAGLKAADLTGADLRGANLSGAICQNTNFNRAAFGATRLGDIDLSEARELDKVRHLSPSTIGLDTIYRSGGRISEAFLRGAGVPDPFIGFVRSLPMRQARAYSCFIANGDRDAQFCERLQADLRGYGVRAWYVPKDDSPGKRFFTDVTMRPRMFEKVIVICSRHSLREGKVLRELEDALRREHSERSAVLVPVRLDNFMLKEWEHGKKTQVTDRAVPDFRGWSRNPAKYEKGLKALLQVLKES
ncbi:MAG: toll/interleukin-1 receptor domain-containing protein [Rudaea sp.]